MRSFLIILFFIFSGLCKAQENMVFDQAKIEGELKGLNEKDTQKKMNEYVKKFLYMSPSEAIKYFNFAIKYANERELKEEFIAGLYLKRGQTLRKERKHSLALMDFLKAENVYLKYRNLEGLQETCFSLANLYAAVSDNLKAIKFALRAKDYALKLKNAESIGSVYNTLANLYKAQGQLDKAFEYYHAAYKFLLKKNDKAQQALVLDNIGMLWQEVKNIGSANIDSSYKYNQMALKIAYEIKNPYLELQLMANAAGTAEYKQNYEEQLKYALRSKVLADSLNLDAYKVYSDLNYAASLNNLNRDKEAIAIFRNCVVKLKEYQDYYALPTAYSEMAESFEKLKQFDSALVYLRLNKEATDSLNTIKSKDKVTEILMKADIDQREEKIQSLKKLNAALKEKQTLSAEKDRLKSIMLYGAIILLFVIIILLIITFKRFKDNKKLSAEILLKNKTLVTKNNEITDSINYAKRIQEALLPAQNELSNTFADSFILYQPKDIVSGDFYWVHKEKDLLFFAVGDCTGHGVPGGFMSMLGHSFLNEVVNERQVREPAEVLNQLREKVISALRQKGTTGENKDGMDITLIIIDIAKNKLQYAAANNSFYLLRNGMATEYKADKQPIGYYSNTMRPFTQHYVDLVKGDCLFLFTDGYPDQFGGNKGKKFKYSSLQKLLEQHANLPMSKQKEMLVETFENWRGRYEQTDDVCVAGIRI